MPTLTYGPMHVLLQNAVHELGSRKNVIFSNLAVQVAMDNLFTAPTSIAAATTVETAARYIRCTTGTALVRVLHD